MANTILLKGRGCRLELEAGGAITPGHLLKRNSDGKLVVHPSAKMRASALFAVENDLVGEGIDDAYASGDFVQAEYLHAGDEVYALVAASATAITQGALLESAGDGTLRLITDFTDAEIDAIGGGAIAEALEAVDNSAGITPARIKVVIL